MKKITYIAICFTLLLACTLNIFAGDNGILYLEDFGAVYNDNIDDSQAFRDALNAAENQNGAVIQFSTGTLDFNSKINVPDVNITFQGVGMDSTILNWTARGGLSNVRPDGESPDNCMELKYLTINTTVANDTGLTVMAHGDVLIKFIMHDVKIAGSNGGYWKTCFAGDIIAYTQLTDCTFLGDPAYTGKLATITGFSIASRFLNCKLQGGQIGFYFTGSMEGTFVINNDISDVNTGIIRELTTTKGGAEPLFDVIHNRISAYTKCIEMRGVASSNIAENLLVVKNPENAEKAYGIFIDGANIERVITYTGNTFINEGNQNETSGFYAANFDHQCNIVDNKFIDFKYGVTVLNSDQILIGDNEASSTKGNEVILYNISGVNNLIAKVDTVQAPPENLTVTASGFKDDPSATYSPSNTIDNDLNTQWAVEGNNEWIMFELDQSRNINTIEIAFYEGNIRTYNFDVQVSEDGTDFNLVYSGKSNGVTSDFEKFDLDTAKGKYVKILAKGSTVDTFNSYSEVRIYYEDNHLEMSALTDYFPGNTEPVFLVVEVENPLQSPFKGIIQIPGVLEAENYDKGEEGVSFHDSDDKHNGEEYRKDAVDIVATSDGFGVGYVNAGEWLEYTVNVEETDKYDITVYYSTKLSTGILGLEFPDEEIVLFNDLALPQTSDWDNYSTIVKPNIYLNEGKQVLRLNVVAKGFNIDKITFEKAQKPSSVNDLTTNVYVYPNPSKTGCFKMNISQGWKVFNLNGSTIKEGNGSLIDLSSYPKGLYMLLTKNGIKKLVFK